MERSHNESAANTGSVAGAADSGSSLQLIPSQSAQTWTQSQMTPSQHNPSANEATTTIAGITHHDAQASGSSYRPLTKQDWEAHKQIIREEYLVQNRTLKDVIQSLKSKHGFSATPKMYKTRLALWGISKNTPKKQRQPRMEKVTSQPLDLSLLEEMQPQPQPVCPQFIMTKVSADLTVPLFQEPLRSEVAESLPPPPPPKAGALAKKAKTLGPSYITASAAPLANIIVVRRGPPHTTITNHAQPQMIVSGDGDIGPSSYSPSTEYQQINAYPSAQSDTIYSPARYDHHTLSVVNPLAVSNTAPPYTSYFYHSNQHLELDSILPSEEEHHSTTYMMPPHSMRSTQIYAPSPTRLHVSSKGHQLKRDFFYECMEVTCSGQDLITLLGGGWNELNVFLVCARGIQPLMAESKFEEAGELMRQTSAQVEPLMRGIVTRQTDGPPVAMIGMLRMIRLFHRDLPEFLKAVMMQAHELAVLWVPWEQHPMRKVLACMIENFSKPEAEMLAVVGIASEAFAWLSAKVVEGVSSREAVIFTWLLLLMTPEGTDDFMAQNHGYGLWQTIATFSRRFGDNHPRTIDVVGMYDIYAFRERKAMNLKLTTPEQLAMAMVNLMGINAAEIGATVAVDASTGLLTPPSWDAEEDIIESQFVNQASSAAERVILEVVQDCLLKAEFRTALSFYDLLEQWHAFREDTEHEARTRMWRRQLEMDCGWMPES